MSEVRRWEQYLNRISETIDIWLIVQRKWIYLEGIFTGSDDIKQQLSQDANKFDKNDKAFKKIMDTVEKNKNIQYCCVVNEGRLMELKNLSDELEKR